ncbi:hypothetical protein BH09MYX1_BH09MYX1_46640 [soil metagenome]
MSPRDFTTPAFGSVLTLLTLLTLFAACEPKASAPPPSATTTVKLRASVSELDASFDGADSASTDLDLHPGGIGPCSADDECIVSNESASCCPCCGVPPRAMPKSTYDGERATCARTKVKCADCDSACKPIESADFFRPVCVDEVCRAKRLH